MDFDVFEFSQGVDKVYCFLEPDPAAVMTNVISAGTDPVELTSDGARKLASALLQLADRLDAHDAA